MSKSETFSRIEPLGTHHDRAAFSCGVEALDRYLHQQAGQDERRDVARVFVAIGSEPEIVAGYYTLSSYKITLDEIPDREKKRLPRYPDVPAALVGRLAVSREYQGKGLGGILIVDALHRIIQTGSNVASYAAVVHAKDESASRFYQKYGFIPFQSQKKHLFIPIATAMKLFPAR